MLEMRMMLPEPRSIMCGATSLQNPPAALDVAVHDFVPGIIVEFHQ